MSDECTKCPFCGSPLRVAYKERTDYPLVSIDGPHIEIEDQSGSTYYTELIHIACDGANGCGRYWYSTEEFHEDRERAGDHG